MEVRCLHSGPLPCQAVAILHQLQEITGRYELVFAGRNTSARQNEAPFCGCFFYSIKAHQDDALLALRIFVTCSPRVWPASRLSVSRLMPSKPGVSATVIKAHNYSLAGTTLRTRPPEELLAGSRTRHL